MKIWNNELITVKGKSLFFEKWLDHGLMYLSDLFDSSLRIYSYDSFFVYVQLSYKMKIIFCNNQCYSLRAYSFNVQPPDSL